MAASSCCAASIATPCFSRPTTASSRKLGWLRKSAGSCHGTHNPVEDDEYGNRNPSGITPISVNDCSSSVILRPTEERSAPKCPCQNAYDATTTFEGSPSPNVRPTSGATPSKLNS